MSKTVHTHTLISDDGDCTTAVTCSVCKKDAIAPAKAHVLASNWSKDEIHHWKKCSNEGCTKVMTDKAPHTLTSDSNVCTGCAYVDTSIFSIKGEVISGCNPGEYTSITIPSSVLTIKQGALKDCTSITSLTLPIVGASLGVLFGASSYKENSSYVPSSLKTVVIAGGTGIGYSFFKDCNGLVSITILDSVTSIGENAFSGCSGLTKIVIPNSVTSIEYATFSDCSGLTEIVIPNSVTSIGHSAFKDCSGLTEIVIPDSVTSIEYATFFGCEGLISIEIPNSVTSIGDSAFYGCSGLTEIVIPNSVISIGEYAFRECHGLRVIDYEGTIAEWQAMGKQASWNEETSDYIINCNDGTLTKAQS